MKSVFVDRERLDIFPPPMQVGPENWSFDETRLSMLACGPYPPARDRHVLSRQEVVVVDGLPETEEVLRAVFEPRGMDVVRVPSPAALEGVGCNQTSVLVLHSDEAAADSLDLPARAAVPRVLIGRMPLAEAASDQGCRCLPQPFHYADLIAAIEELAAASES